jgi:hypothetical protein
MRFKIQFKIPFTKKEFFHGQTTCILPQRTERTAGTLNRTLDNRFVFYGDWDRIAYDFLMLEANILQRNFKLSDFYLFHCKDHKDGWHVQTLDKLHFWEFYDLLKESTCDHNYKLGCFYSPARCWTLRFAEKGDRDRVEYYGVLPSKYQKREKSRAHAELLKALGAEVNWQGKFDNYHMTDIEVFEGIKLPNGLRDKVRIGGVTTEAYSTASHVSKKSTKEEFG